MTNPKVPLEEIEKRRELIRGFMARGITRPSKLLQQPQIKATYEGYKNPYERIRRDIKIVRKENAKVLGTITGDEVLGDYRVGLQELISKTWIELEDTMVSDNPFGVNLLIKRLADLYKDYARSMGVDVEKLDPQQLIHLRGGYDVNVDGKVEVAKTHEFRFPDDPKARAIATRLVEQIRAGEDKSGDTSVGD